MKISASTSLLSSSFGCKLLLTRLDANNNSFGVHEDERPAQVKGNISLSTRKEVEIKYQVADGKFSFQKGKSHSNAISRAASEWNV